MVAENDVMGCPTGCEKAEIEVGREQQSFMAVLGAPHQHLRCGKCGFNGDSKTVDLAHSIEDAVANWNKAVQRESETV